MKNKLLGSFLLICGLYLIVSSGKSIIYLWNAGKKVGETQKKFNTLQKQNQELKDKLKEVKSPEYIEKIARDELNLGKEGESVVILPEEIQNIKPQKSLVKTTPNWQKWYRLFF